MSPTQVPDVVIKRLPLYLQSLSSMAARGKAVVSSAELGEATGVSSAQVRKDLSFFGEFGKQGLGYDIDFLMEQLTRILQLDQDWHIVLVGAGALGHALANYRIFERQKFHIKGVFDNDPLKIGQPIGELVIQSMDDLSDCSTDGHVEMGIIAVPEEHAQEVADALVHCGVRAILNYAPIRLVVPDSVHVAYMDPVASLQGMTYYL